MVWVTRAFDLLAEMERLSIFPSQHTLNAVCKLGQWTGDKCLINGVPAWKASLDKWHEWIIRPEDFGYKFYPHLQKGPPGSEEKTSGTTPSH
jgi:hypothetical protein